MKLKKFITKTAAKVILFACVMIVTMSIIQSPIITNEVALAQMYNSNEAHILMSMWPKIRQISIILCAGITILFASNIACDTYKFVKNIKKNEKEKN